MSSVGVVVQLLDKTASSNRVKLTLSIRYANIAAMRADLVKLQTCVEVALAALDQSDQSGTATALSAAVSVLEAANRILPG